MKMDSDKEINMDKWEEIINNCNFEEDFPYPQTLTEKIKNLTVSLL